MSSATETSKTSGRQTILSGMQPSGSLHIGNLEGALRNWVRLQQNYDMYACIVDWHSLTGSMDDLSGLRERIFQMAIDFLSAGLDPKHVAIFIQSDVKEHAELHLIFSMLVTVPTLTRLPTYTEKKESLDTYGFLGYPVLQAADICLYGAHKVPVGKDQEKHIWLANDVAKRFNQTFGQTLVEPEALFTEIPLILGADNRKMSKSYDNHVPIDYSEKDTETRIRTFITDPQKVRKNDPGRPEVCPVYLLHRVYTANHAEEIAPHCRSGQLGCVDCKLRAAKNVNSSLAPIREKRAELLRKPSQVWEILDDGASRARSRAQQVMGSVREAMKMNYREQVQ